MKLKFKKAACLLLSIMTTLLFSMPGFAVDTVTTVSGHIPHEGDENCIYSCILEETSQTQEYTTHHEHIPHKGDENCINSCDNEINHIKYSGELVWTEEILENFQQEFTNAESYDEMNAIIIKYYNASPDFDVRDLIVRIGD